MIDIAPANVTHQEFVEFKTLSDGRVSGQRALPGGAELGTTSDPKAGLLLLNSKHAPAKDGSITRETLTFKVTDPTAGASFAKAYLADGVTPDKLPQSYSCRNTFNNVSVTVARQEGLDNRVVNDQTLTTNPGMKGLQNTTGPAYGLMISKPGEAFAPVYARGEQVGKMVEQAKLQCGLAPK